jgi:hypothetical protein
MSGAALGAVGLVVLAVFVGCGSFIGSLRGWNSWLGVMIAPLLALNGCVLAFIALKSIERASGSVMGRPLALVALFCGVGLTAIQGALVLFALVTLSASHSLAPVTSDLVNYTLADRERLARGLLSESVSERMSAEELDAFALVIRQRLGDSSTGSAGFRLIVDARQTISNAGPMEGYQPASDRLPRPVFLEFDEQRVLAYVFVDPAALKDREIRIDDMLLFLGDAEAIVLAPDGPARELADAAGWTVVEPGPDQDLMLE